MTPPASETLPDGFAVRLSPRTKVRDGGRCLVGGTAGRVVFLAPAAVERLAEPTGLVVRDQTSRRLARLLLDRGLADPCWPAWARTPAEEDEAVGDVTVVVPVLDRPDALARLLGALPREIPVVVVDDGSRDPASIGRVAAAAGADVVRHERNAGPAAARNSGLARVTTPYVAFVDSDVVPEPGWLSVLRRHLADPATGLVAPRVHGVTSGADAGWLTRYEEVRSSLDLGHDPAAVRILGTVAYVPSACVLARVDALGEGFATSMRSGEDVDLVWRLLGAGWRVRYEPGAAVRHDHRTTVRAWLGRKAFYGSSAGRLAERHGDAVAPMVLSAWTAVLTGAVLAQRRWSVPVALGSWGVATVGLSRRLERADSPLRTAARLTLEGAAAAHGQAASALCRHYWPVSVVVSAFSVRARRALLVAAVVDAALDHHHRRPRLDPARYLVARRLDDAAYGAGLWGGVMSRVARGRSWGALRALAPQWRS
ncbi:putative glycosyltransferase [Marmoricola endophyticus]|uniref:Glycosyltransferase n=1 Tax=Marmoricola endophyticus TaxID=2040280 RepID=A0A917BR19_9ACTN|nr:mycofactocin biosynthesis glycosyltransferase MftF [Marmoricola endophyticus]GGF53721.1 putative glycosyltransferase [Marmoricola endophyticus]